MKAEKLSAYDTRGNFKPTIDTGTNVITWTPPE